MRILTYYVEAPTRDPDAERRALKALIAQEFTITVDGVPIVKPAGAAPPPALRMISLKLARSCVYGNPERCAALKETP